MTDLIDADRPATAEPPARLAGSAVGAPAAGHPATDVQAAPAPMPFPPPTPATLAPPAMPAPAPAPTLAPTPTADLAPIANPAPIADPAPAANPAPAATPAPIPAPTPAADPAPIPAEAPGPGPALVTGPAAILSDDSSYAPLDQSVPALPSATAVAPANTAAASVSSTPAAPLTLEDLLGSQQPKKAKKKGTSVGRTFARLLMLAALAAGGYAAYLYGPDLYDEYVKGETAEDQPVETDAPLAFPSAAPATGPIRTAEFILEGLPSAPEMTYRVTTDFETNVSQVDMSRPNGPDLQVLTYGDAALIRRAGAEQWYQLERGRFPLDDRLERSDWVRQLDELLPTTVRSSVTIDAAGETTVSGVPTRHLALTLDLAVLGGTSPAPGADTVPAESVPADPALVEPTAPNSSLPADPSTSGSTDRATSDSATASLETSLDVWVDAQGIVRKVTGAPRLGAETITVVRTDSAAWVPDYPAPEFVQPLTAATLVELGI